MKDCTNNGTRSPHSAIACSNSPAPAHIHFRQVCTRPWCMGTHSEAFRIIGNDLLLLKAITSSAFRAITVSGMQKPAARAIWTCMHLFNANSAFLPLGPPCHPWRPRGTAGLKEMLEGPPPAGRFRGTRHNDYDVVRTLALGVQRQPRGNHRPRGSKPLPERPSLLQILRGL
jgi:hypothetical protein